jgi:hypothetical protein
VTLGIPITVDGQELKAAAGKLREEIAARIRTTQRGVPTFFDKYVSVLIDHLTSTESDHQWRVTPAAAPGDPLEEVQGYLHWLERLVSRRDMGRFVSYNQRRALSSAGDSSDIVDLDMVMSQGAGPCISWKGQPIFKTVFDYALVPMLLWDLKPATILEIGSGTGASAVWMADLVRGLAGGGAGCTRLLGRHSTGHFTP